MNNKAQAVVSHATGEAYPVKRRIKRGKVTECLPAVQPAPLPMTDADHKRFAMQEFHDAYIRMALELPKITKDGKIQLIKNGAPVGKPIRFASFENIHDSVMPTLLKYGFRLSFHGQRMDDGSFWIQTVLRRGGYGEDSLWPVDKTPASPAMNANQANGAGGTYACRYGMMRLLNLNSHAPEDRDTDATEVKFITGKQAKALSDRLAALEIAEDRFCKAYGIPSIDKLPAAQFAQADQAITTKEKAAQQ